MTRAVGGLRVVVSDRGGHRLAMPGLTRWLTRVAPARTRGIVSVALVSNAQMRVLNRKYRRKDHATDVLSFGSGSSPKSRVSSRKSAGPSRQPRVPNSPPQRTRGTWRVNRGLTSGSSESSVVESFLGDIVIARGVARRQARAARHSELTELRVLALHGLLHLLGYDHEQDQGTMERLERKLRKMGGL